MDTFFALVEAGVVLVVVRRVERRMEKRCQGGMTATRVRVGLTKKFRFVLEECSPFRPPEFR